MRHRTYAAAVKKRAQFAFPFISQDQGSQQLCGGHFLINQRDDRGAEDADSHGVFYVDFDEGSRQNDQCREQQYRGKPEFRAKIVQDVCVNALQRVQE